MHVSVTSTTRADAIEALKTRFASVRARTLALAAPLSDEDQTIQSMDDVSPTKWHLAHTSWFWEAFVLSPFAGSYDYFAPDYLYLFNSYYEQLGPRHPRPDRGLISRPSCAEVRAYRANVDAAMNAFFRDGPSEEACDVIALGLAHEEQHQELLLTDIKHVMSMNPLSPAAYPAGPDTPSTLVPLAWSHFAPELTEVGASSADFAYDNEGPRHRVWIDPFTIANRPVTNQEYAAFITDGGYSEPTLWLSDGWATVQRKGWTCPLYWREAEDGWREFTLAGERALDPNAPACHLSFYEAAAYAEWAGARLPSEHEWEVAAREIDASQSAYAQTEYAAHPAPAKPGEPLAQMFGDVWEWTRSAYLPYPRFKSYGGAAGEYNAKFMSGQFVLRGGSCASAPGHLRATYRNFFPPDARWQFSGVRLARDA